ncbi:hypothetical protein CEW46_21470 [Bacillus cereus]|nr:hypothetical protein CEW46_21470 [Bacillus cereus]
MDQMTKIHIGQFCLTILSTIIIIIKIFTYKPVTMLSIGLVAFGWAFIFTINPILPEILDKLRNK